MKRRLIHLARCLAFEAVLLAFATVATGRLLSLGLWGSGLVALALGVAGSTAGLLLLWRSAELAMAWRCPRLHGLGLVPTGRDAPWEALTASEAAMATLEGAGSYQEFFPEARRHLVQSAVRAQAARQLELRAREALRDAPEGDARGRLIAQQALAKRELADLTAALRDLKARLIASTAPLPSGVAPAVLRELGAQSEVLAESIDSLHRSAEGVH
jgi:hypothetical protein